MTRNVFLFTLFVTGASAAPMTYTITGIGSGSWNSQPFTEASFTFTFDSDTATIVHGTSCCSSADSSPAGTAATVSVAGFAPAALTGNQAIFLNRSEQTAGIWHFNSPDYLTVATPAFANDDLTSTIEPTAGTTFSYVTPLPLSTGGTLYFTSVHDVKYSQHPGSSGGLVTAVSVTPNDSSPALDETQTYNIVVGDTAGASDIGGVDFQVVKDYIYLPCWLYFNASANTLSVYNGVNNEWDGPVPIGSSGSVIDTSGCTLDTKAVTVSTSGNNLTLNLPVALKGYGDGSPSIVYVAAQNKENQGTNYAQMGTVTLPTPPPSEGFQLSVDPQSHAITPGGSADYKVTVTKISGPDQPITFSAKVMGSQYSTLSFTFDPATITGSGTTTMHVTTTPDASPGTYSLQITAQSPNASHTYGDYGGLILYIANAPPVVTLNPTSGAGSSAQFVITWQDGDNPTPVSNLNILIASQMDGRHACWIYWDRAAAPGLYLASDDGASWTGFSTGKLFPDVHPVSNSQCTIDAANVIYNDDPPVAGGNHLGHKSLLIPISFAPGFAGPKTTFVRAANVVGVDTGYQSLGTWTAQ
ncbi:MAG TPA: hypothetical protein VN519_01700 [Bryobacteraceae bacterium]|nr:hypothetical protein [Bryobacteraceae bacterium]